MIEVTAVKKYNQSSFTLIELLAAMVVFSILLVISIRLFSGAQEIWISSERKTDTFASARTAMEFLASRLQTMEYIDDHPFGIVDLKDNDNAADGGFKNPVSGYEGDSIWFVSRMALGDGGHYRHLIRFHLVDPTDVKNSNAGILQIQKFTGHNSEKGFYGQLFPSYSGREKANRTRYRIKNRQEAVNHIEKVWEELDKGEDDPSVTVKTYATSVDLIENVVSFKLVRYVANGNDLVQKNGDAESAPYLIEIELRVLDSKESFKEWQEATSKADKDNIFIEHGYTFHRAVLLGKKGE